MSMLNPLQKLLWTAALGGLAGVGLGCVITVGPLDCDECGNNGCNSQEVGGQCLCDPGYEFANDDPNNYDCDRIPGKGGDANCGGETNIHLEGQVCVCDAGYNWCMPGVESDLSCCEDNMQAPEDTDGDPTGDMTSTTGATSATTTTGETEDSADSTGNQPACEEVEPPGNGVVPEPAECTDEGLVFCSNNDEEGPAGSRFWVCDGTDWVESPELLDEDCQFSDFDFAFGCVDNGTDVEPICGDGPGTPCSGPECDGCADDDFVQFCENGKLAGQSCLATCQDEGIDGVTFDHGFCSAEGGPAECFCCDEGDEGCPI